MPSILKGNNSIISGNTTFTVRPMFGTNVPWDSGNLTPSNYAALSGATFGGPVSIPTLTVTSRPTFANNTPWDSGNFNPSNYLPLVGGNITGQLSVGNSAPAFSTGLNINESVHSSGSKRASILLGSNWQILQDAQGNGTKDFGLFNSATGTFALTVGANNQYVGFAQRPTFGINTPWDSGNFNPSGYAALGSSPTFAGTVAANFFRSNGAIAIGAANTSVNGGSVVMDTSNQNIRIYEAGSPYRGAFIDLTTCASQSLIWTNGNFNPSNYAPLSNPTFPSDVTIKGVANGAYGALVFRSSDGTRDFSFVPSGPDAGRTSMQFQASPSVLSFTVANTGAVTFASNVAVTGTLFAPNASATNIQAVGVGGQVMWQDRDTLLANNMVSYYKAGALRFFVDGADRLSIDKVGNLNSNGTIQSSGAVQIGNGILTGLYGDNTNIAIRAYGNNGNIILQNGGGSFNYAVFNQTSISFGAPVTVGSSLVVNGPAYLYGGVAAPGGIYTNNNVSGGIGLLNGGTAYSGFIEFRPANTATTARHGYIGYVPAGGGGINMSAEGTSFFNFTGSAPLFNSGLNIGGTNVVQFPQATAQKINLWTNTYGLGVQNSTLYIRTSGNFSVHNNGVHSDNQTDPGTGGTEMLRVNPTSMLYMGNNVWHAGNMPANIANAIGYRNRILNGNFTINQRGHPASSTSRDPGTYLLDRWRAGGSGSKTTFTQSGADYVATIIEGSIQQPIEGLRYITEGGNYVLSWTGTSLGRVYATGNTAPPSYAASPIVVSLTAALNTTVEFSTGTVGLVQIEPGSVPTIFERRDDEMIRCQRYFQAGSTTVYCYTGGNGSYAGAIVPVRLSVPMRVAPSTTANNLGGGSYNGTIVSTAINGSVQDIQLWFQSAGGQGSYTGVSWTASAEITN